MVASKLADNGNGTYAVSYCVPADAPYTDRAISVLCNNQHIQNSAFHVRVMRLPTLGPVLAGPADAQQPGQLLIPPPQRVIMLSPHETFVRKFGRRGCDEGQFNCPISVAVSPNGRVYVVDSGGAQPLHHLQVACRFLYAAALSSCDAQRIRRCLRPTVNTLQADSWIDGRRRGIARWRKFFANRAPAARSNDRRRWPCRLRATCLWQTAHTTACMCFRPEDSFCASLVAKVGLARRLHAHTPPTPPPAYMSSKRAPCPCRVGLGILTPPPVTPQPPPPRTVAQARATGSSRILWVWRWR